MNLAKEMKKFTGTGDDSNADIIYHQVIAGILEMAGEGFLDGIIDFDTDNQASAAKRMLEKEGFKVGEIDSTEHSLEVSWDV
ncbi:MAG: hypothetical protein WC523_03930 [Patescibacteria group bacterium]